MRGPFKRNPDSDVEYSVSGRLFSGIKKRTEMPVRYDMLQKPYQARYIVVPAVL